VNRHWRAALPVLSLVWGALSPGRAVAAELRTETSARQVAVGESFTVQLTATLTDGDPAAEGPTLPVRGSAQVDGPSLFTQRRVVMHNFDVRTEKNVVATYQVTPSAKGRLVIGPGTFRLGDQQLRGERFEVEVVEAAPSRGTRRLRGRDPFGFGPDPFGQDPFDALRRASGGVSGYADAPSDLALARAPDALGFLLARTDKSTALWRFLPSAVMGLSASSVRANLS
jgi:hypothetical protein